MRERTTINATLLVEQDVEFVNFFTPPKFQTPKLQNNENGVCTQVWKEQLGQQWQNSDGQPHHMVAKSLDGTLAHFMGLLIPCSRNAQLLSLAIFYLDNRNILTTLTWLCHSFFLQLQPLNSTFDPNFL